MNKTYVTFGQRHKHTIDGKIFDKDCVAVINSDSPEQGRELVFAYFGTKFSMEYPEEQFDFSSLGKYYPRGLIEVN